jgi:hypothetical protein
VFNAQLFTAGGRLLKQIDLDLTLDGAQLNEVARAVRQNFYVLYENDPTPFWRPGDKPISAVLREAVWWTKFRPQDQDRFLPLTAGPLWKKQVPLRCVTGRWQKQPAFSVDLWSKPGWESLRNYSGAVVQLSGHPPRGFRPTEQAEAFTAEVSTTRGRPVRPVFYQHSGVLDYVWFNHGAAMPAVLYDHTLRLMQGLSFTVHRDNSATHRKKKLRFAKVTDEPGGWAIAGQIWGIDAETDAISRDLADRLFKERRAELVGPSTTRMQDTVTD